MDGILFTIIIPIFNRGIEIIDTLDSVKNQTFLDYEVILIDDGSTDNTFEILKKYSENNPKFKLYHYENGGLSVARNRGIKRASGKYILFLDADDRIDINTLKKLSEYQNKYNADLVVFGLKYYYTKSNYSCTQNKLEKKVIYDKEKIKKYILPSIVNLDTSNKYSIEPYACNKLYKRSILKENCILFDETRTSWEDKPFVAIYVSKIENMIILDEAFYHYIDTKNSLSRRYEKRRIEMIVENANLFESLFKNDVIFDEKNISRHYFNQINKELINYMSFGKEKYDDIISIINFMINNDKIRFWYKNIIPQNYIQKKIIKYFFSKDIKKYFRMIRMSFLLDGLKVYLNKLKKFFSILKHKLRIIWRILNDKNKANTGC